ncbi:MAG: hypothetical protein IJU55_02655 [Selenomonadaceae bacterium]|nr:hypothetical protein [Selenomonadaceae bacterium]
MAVEPNKENFLAQMKDADFDISQLDVDAMQEIFWYLNRPAEVLGDVFDKNKTSRREAEQIITNLAKIYPLSREIVLAIMSNSRSPQYSDGKKIYRDAAFLEGFDVAEKVKQEILSTLKDIEDRVVLLTKDTRDYRQSLENLKSDRQRLERAAADLDKLRNERNRLEREVEKLREDTDEKKLQSKIDELNVEIQRLEGKKRRHNADVEEKSRRINELEAELQALEKNIDNEEEIRLIRELLRKFPADAEG